VRILLASDLHYALPQFDWLVEQASSFDLVVLAGDHLNLASSVPLEAQSLVVLRYLELLRERTRVAVSSGNHDLTGPDGHGEQAALWLADAHAAGIPTDGTSFTFDDTLVTICPWWDGPVGRDTLDAQLRADAAQRPGRWIWVYHWPPLGSPTCWTGRRDYGDADLVGWIDTHRPDLVLTGHVHEPPFQPGGSWHDHIGSTWVFNPGKQIGAIPAHVVIDLDGNEASWWSYADSATISL
jgi:Icc-related predicted phosphoesterase